MAVEKIYAATGHRPPKVGGYSTEARERLIRIAKYHLSTSPLGMPDKGISGMALGWDTAWAMALIQIGIPLIAAIPFEGQESRWTDPDKRLFNDIIKQAESVYVVSGGGYAGWKMQARNKWMVDHATRVTALWDGSPSGTANCIGYAEKVGTPVDNIWNIYEKMYT